MRNPQISRIGKSKRFPLFCECGAWTRQQSFFFSCRVVSCFLVWLQATSKLVINVDKFCQTLKWSSSGDYKLRSLSIVFIHQNVNKSFIYGTVNVLVAMRTFLLARLVIRRWMVKFMQMFTMIYERVESKKHYQGLCGVWRFWLRNYEIICDSVEACFWGFNFTKKERHKTVP